MATFQSAPQLPAGGGGTAAQASQYIGSSGGSFSYASIVPAITGIIGALGQAEAIEHQNEMLIQNMELKAEALRFSQNNTAQQLEDLRRVAGDKLTETGFEALQMESRLKAASAETGGTGTSINDAIATAEMNRLHQDAAILRSYDVSKGNLLTSMVAERLSFENTISGMASGINTSSTSNLLSTLNAFGQGANIGLNMMTTSQKEQMFGINTTGTVK